MGNYYTRTGYEILNVFTLGYVNVSPGVGQFCTA